MRSQANNDEQAVRPRRRRQPPDLTDDEEIAAAKFEADELAARVLEVMRQVINSGGGGKR